VYVSLKLCDIKISSINNALERVVAKLKCFYFSVTCKRPCQNGGICLGLNRCKCPNGYGGSVCQHGMYELVIALNLVYGVFSTFVEV